MNKRSDLLRINKGKLFFTNEGKRQILVWLNSHKYGRYLSLTTDQLNNIVVVLERKVEAELVAKQFMLHFRIKLVLIGHSYIISHMFKDAYKPLRIDFSNA